jgi:MoaD family protein
MNIRVGYYGQARDIVGVEREDVEVGEDASIQDAVVAVVDRHMKLKDLLLSSDGALRKSVLLPVNDEVVDTVASGVLKDGDELSVFPAVSGG